MGQAKLKGDQESRIAVGIANKLKNARQACGGEYRFTHLFPGLSRAVDIDVWIARASDIAKTENVGETVSVPFIHILAYIWLTGYQGACHSTSAALFIVLREQGLSPQLTVGEVGFGEMFFDHSWVELDGFIFDAAVSLPLPGGAAPGGPVFASRSLDHTELTTLGYGDSSGLGIGVDAKPAVERSLYEYSLIQPTPTIWSLASSVLAAMGRDVRVDTLKAKYGSITRTFRVNR